MRTIKILIVEDEVLIAENLRRFLEKRGYIVVGIAISYEEAVQLYLMETPDVALIDIRLNGRKTGIDFAHFIRTQSDWIPFVFLTSLIDGRYLDAIKRTLPSACLSKPINKNELLAAIEIAGYKATHSSENLA